MHNLVTGGTLNVKFSQAVRWIPNTSCSCCGFVMDKRTSMRLTNTLEAMAALHRRYING